MAIRLIPSNCVLSALLHWGWFDGMEALTSTWWGSLFVHRLRFPISICVTPETGSGQISIQQLRVLHEKSVCVVVVVRLCLWRGNGGKKLGNNWNRLGQFGKPRFPRVWKLFSNKGWRASVYTLPRTHPMCLRRRCCYVCIRWILIIRLKHQHIARGWDVGWKSL